MISGSLLARHFARDPLFGACSARDVATLACVAQRFDARRGEAVLGDRTPASLGFVRRGVLAAFMLAPIAVRGGVRKLGTYETFSGGTFGEVAMLDGGQSLGDVTVISARATGMVFPAAAIREIAQRDPKFHERLARRAAERARTLAHRCLEHLSRPVVPRVAEILLPFAQTRTGLAPADPLLGEIIQRDIAACAGCVKEAATRAITELEARGALRREHGRIRYLNRAVLRRCVQPDQGTSLSA